MPQNSFYLLTETLENNNKTYCSTTKPEINLKYLWLINVHNQRVLSIYLFQFAWGKVYCNSDLSGMVQNICYCRVWIVEFLKEQNLVALNLNHNKKLDYITDDI
jgi:hypothetical protein